MTDPELDTDILIVGAGPVGLFLANECARRRIRCMLIESRPAQSEHSKALAVMPRTMEIFDMAGIAAPFEESANRVTSIAMTKPSGTLARMPFAPKESPYPYVSMVPQDVTEQILSEQLRRKSGDVDYRTNFVSAVQSEHCVAANVESNDKTREIRAAFLVGCDGAHSAVRHSLDLRFQGKAYDAFFMLADIETNESLPASEMQLCPSEFGPLAIFPMSPTRRRLVATVTKEGPGEPSLEIVRRLLAERGPRGMEALGIHWSSYFRVHHRQVERLRLGRIFLAGDAAHIHSPIGGQGMNTGLDDVWNLAWKLDFAVRGFARQQLLDSYDIERSPIIRGVIEMTDLMTKGLGTPSKAAQIARDLAIPLLFRLRPFQHMMVQRLSHLGISYAASPIVLGDGQRYFDSSLRGGGLCSKFILMIGNGAERSAARQAERLSTDMSDVLELRTVPGGCVRLVRPDGYIAYEAAKGGADAIKRISSLLDAMIAGST
ncbi:MAG TPA: FAD-dependent monooxygenase [Allosphingosinicella sp.]|nr:FAD-dependent monooxygenase [Allosphingosinicella sp.]